MGLVIISLVNRLSWAFQTADIHTSGWASVLLQELSQVIQLVTKVMCSLIFDLECLIEVFDLLVFLLLL